MHRIFPDYPESKLLIIDDQKTVAYILAKLLNEAGYDDVTYIHDPREALSTCEQLKPDLILLDLTMPYLSGFDLLELFKKEKSQQSIPIIVLTSDQDQESKLKALALGASDFLPKPVDRVELLVRIKNNLEIRYQHKLLEQKVAERTRELKETQIEIIQRLVKAAEYRDNDTGDHIVRMSMLCFHLAKAAGLPDEECELIRYASSMHDVGKIGIPDSILLKPGKLTDEEFAEMKNHTLIGGKMLSNSDTKVLQMAEEIAVTHHERWDGSGYPSGLAGEAIPLAGRITSICDVFDALTSIRPYKKAWPLGEAMEEIKRLRGTHFDPELADIFIAALPSIIESDLIFSHLKK
ncbi:HD domain-containing phosphohydrolase [Paenibacillus hamazuiensis]|uniref:HD domain-containing phosphohydrolase n=1 Tax=Paenibacillus hamazuiensis TaxID=2936508 RepID=UPI00200E7EDE|nr:HD domain-containing phosphohydrolase [Paenibacillus hamazuiensis]